MPERQERQINDKRATNVSMIDIKATRERQKSDTSDKNCRSFVSGCVSGKWVEAKTWADVQETQDRTVFS